ncbi:MAG: serine/threonine protein kinase [Candidatus Ozemobacter sibiricus]|jgi:serine/threonine protein kinase|uniref:Serine/threonine protein kinase n=1 Tax=Candidatus Ozemobacter sibiricus TaxID=2268124 RepID=A0A367ZTT2_9BACT|nr:MAG: serine/threonine protein kinase [Candidatus Ozemobacter sibiricus]
MFPNGALINGRYRLLIKLGEGGMGAVFKAYEAEMSRVVALKFLHPDVARDPVGAGRFRQEGEILATIRHPRIVEIYCLETEEKTGLPFMVMEFFPGRSLMDFQKRLAQDPLRVIRLFIDLLDGVQAFHARQIVHRDLKPANLLLDPRGALKIVDFGIAKGARQQTQPGLALGTPWYMSPEQCEGKPDITPKSDIYSLGVVLWEVLTGAPPFKVPTEASDPMLAAIIQHLTAPPPLEELERSPFGVWFTDLLRAMLEKDPKRRPEIPAIVEALQTIKSRLLARSDAIEWRFPVHRLLQAGPFGGVHEGRDARTEAPVLIRVLVASPACHRAEEGPSGSRPDSPRPAPGREADSGQASAIERRLQRLAEVKHPVLCPVIQYGYDQEKQRFFLIQEAPGGDSLRARREALGQDRQAAATFLLRLLEGLEPLHRLGEPHGNIHPDFLGIDQQGNPRLSGFPITARTTRTRAESGEAGRYLAPEQWGPEPATPAADIYSAGLVFWEALFGKLPASVPDQSPVAPVAVAAASTLAETLSLQPLSPQDPLFPFLDSLLAMLRPDPRQRPSLGDLLRGLRDVVAAFDRAVVQGGRGVVRRQCLILTRDAAVATLIELTLKEYGFQARRARSYADMTRLSGQVPTVAWFIDLDGYLKSVADITALALKAAPEAKMVFLATAFTRELAEECLDQRAVGLLVKPLVIPRLVQTLNALCEEPELVERDGLSALRPDLAGDEAVSRAAVGQGGSPLQILFFECGVCGERFGSPQFKPGAFEVQGTETDFCPICPAGVVPELYAIVVCPSCLYANFAGRFSRVEAAAEALASFLAPPASERRSKVALDLDFGGERGLVEGCRSYELAALTVEELAPLEYDRQASGIFLKGAWLCRRLGKPLMETEFLSRSLECLVRLYHPYLLLSSRFPGWEAVQERLKPGQKPLSERAVVVNGFLAAELSARLGLAEQAEFYFEQVFGLPFLSRYPLLSRHIHAAYRTFKFRTDQPPDRTSPGA